MNAPFSLKGRTALIAGASSGLGARFACCFAAAGAQVVLGARRLDRVTALAQELEAQGAQALGVALDVTDEASVHAAYDAAEARFGTVDTIVANAGAASGGRATDIPLAGLKSVFDTNLLGVYLVAREGARRLIDAGSRDSGKGRIILIGSITALQNGTGDAAYAATKAGIAHLGKQFAREWVRQGINVNTVQPGWIHTEINDAFHHTAEGAAAVQLLHRRRIQSEDSLDDMMLYLASDRSQAVTGSIFTIDDGQSL